MCLLLYAQVERTLTKVGQITYTMSMAKRAKTATEKKQIILRLHKLWLKNPHMRLTQLMENVFHHSSTDHCFYFVEDFDLLDKLEEYYKEKEEKIIN